MATDEFIVFIDNELAIDWKTTPEWDKKYPKEQPKYSAILNRAAALESDDWDQSDQQKTLNLRRQIGEALARCFDNDYENAEKMLSRAEEYRLSMLDQLRRSQAIKGQVNIRNKWRKYHGLWSAIHYTIGIGALLFSTLVASRPALLGLTDNAVSFVAWLVALLAGLLTFLTPDKKADKYIRAWSTLDASITRYNADKTYTVDDVLEAYHQAESLILETSERRRAKYR